MALHAPLWAVDTVVPEPAALAPEPIDISPKLASIQKLEEAGKYSEAQKLYENLLEEQNLSEEDYQKIQKSYDDLNIKFVFSRFPMDGSEFYTVKAGDSLYLIGKKFDMPIALIKKSNGLQKDTIYPGMKLKVYSSKFSIRVDKSENALDLYLGEKKLKRYKVSTGKENSTPTGEFKVVNKVENPTWYRTGAVVPPDSPENILGTRWLGFDYAGYGIHGTTLPDSIGKQASSGCIRMLNQEVEEIYSIIPQGTKVIITD